MARTYTYDPEKILENGLDRMRFELGDIMVEGREATAALADEEIRAALSLVESVCRRFAYEVDTKTSKLSLSLGQRAKLWQDMYQALKAEVEAESIGLPLSVNENQGHKPYFYTGMMQNFAGGGTEQG